MTIYHNMKNKSL